MSCISEMCKRCRVRTVWDSPASERQAQNERPAQNPIARLPRFRSAALTMGNALSAGTACLLSTFPCLAEDDAPAGSGGAAAQGKKKPSRPVAIEPPSFALLTIERDKPDALVGKPWAQVFIFVQTERALCSRCFGRIPCGLVVRCFILLLTCALCASLSEYRCAPRSRRPRSNSGYLFTTTRRLVWRAHRAPVPCYFASAMRVASPLSIRSCEHDVDFCRSRFCAFPA